MAHKLLLADDSVTIQRVIELTFADEDVQVTAVGDGRQAIERIRADQPDIVLADVDMPERDGFEVAAFVKQDPALRHIPVLLLTGAFEPVDEARVREAGCDGVLAKPFEPQLLIARVKELLAGAPPSQGAGPAVAPPPEQAAEVVAAAPDIVLDDEPLHVEPATEVSPELDGTAASQEAGSRKSIDDYFDQLDAAFSSRVAAGNDPAVESGDAPPAWSSPVVAATDWSQTAPVKEAGAEAGEPGAVAVVPPDGSPAGGSPVIAGVAPEIAAAFEWLFAAEQGLPLPSNALPLGVAGQRAAAMDTIVDEITRRVVERLADRAVHDQVVEIVSAVAERLVREEIERLKALQ